MMKAISYTILFWAGFYVFCISAHPYSEESPAEAMKREYGTFLGFGPDYSENEGGRQNNPKVKANSDTNNDQLDALEKGEIREDFSKTFIQVVSRINKNQCPEGRQESKSNFDRSTATVQASSMMDLLIEDEEEQHLDLISHNLVKGRSFRSWRSVVEQQRRCMCGWGTCDSSCLQLFPAFLSVVLLLGCALYYWAMH
jgi:hypothetical protein